MGKARRVTLAGCTVCVDDSRLRPTTMSGGQVISASNVSMNYSTTVGQ